LDGHPGCAEREASVQFRKVLSFWLFSGQSREGWGRSCSEGRLYSGFYSP
jgi:hypothetical protein